jgi:hypothetical protein
MDGKSGFVYQAPSGRNPSNPGANVGGHDRQARRDGPADGEHPRWSRQTVPGGVPAGVREERQGCPATRMGGGPPDLGWPNKVCGGNKGAVGPAYHWNSGCSGGPGRLDREKDPPLREARAFGGRPCSWRRITARAHSCFAQRKCVAASSSSSSAEHPSATGAISGSRRIRIRTRDSTAAEGGGVFTPGSLKLRVGQWRSMRTTVNNSQGHRSQFGRRGRRPGRRGLSAPLYRNPRRRKRLASARISSTVMSSVSAVRSGLNCASSSWGQ